jgi:hypothetical protein
VTPAKTLFPDIELSRETEVLSERRSQPPGGP